MKKSFDKITESLDSTPLDAESAVVSIKNDLESIIIAEDPDEDYEYTRGNLYSLIKKGQEAIDGIMELAQQSDSPRAYEVAGQLIKSVGDVTDKLLDLQQKMKKLKEEEIKTPKNITNNTMFVGSTADLQRLIKNGFSSTEDSK